jgi:uncharacterized protein YbaP (TraB family)
MHLFFEQTNIRILGSMHKVPSEYPEPPGWVWGEYKWSDVVVFEHEVDASMLHLMNLPKGETVEQRLPSDVFQKLKAVWPDHSRSGMVRNQKLWYILGGIGQQAIELADGVDSAFQQQAIKDGKPMSYLESSVEFVELVDGIEESHYVRAIERALNDFPQHAVLIQEMYAAWFHNDLLHLRCSCPEGCWHRTRK